VDPAVQVEYVVRNVVGVDAVDLAKKAVKKRFFSVVDAAAK
jgi:hypothetical protein